MYIQTFEQFLDSLYKPSESYGKVFFYRWYNAIGAYYATIGMEEADIIGFLREHPVDIARAYKYCPDLKPEIFAARHWATYKVPTSEEEGFKILDQIYPLEEKRMALDKTKEEFTGDEHFELGMWIRNNWIHRPDMDDPVLTQRYDACYAMLSGEGDAAYPFRHYDDLSADFLAKYYDHLKATCRINDPVEEVSRKPVKCPHCGGKVLRIQYGYPGPELFEAADRGEILLGGCCISPDSPDYACPTCGQAYIKSIRIDR